MTGCGPSIPPPRDRLHTTEAAIAVAEKSGADKVPNASEVLVNARAGVARAKASMKEGKNREAEALLVRAGADAELADALAHEGEVAQEVAKAKARLAEDPAAKPVEENKK